MGKSKIEVDNSPGAIIIGGNNSGVIQGDNSFYDNSKTYIDDKQDLRRLSEENIRKMTDALKSCNGIDVDIICYTQDYEVIQLMNAYKKIFLNAGLKTKAPMWKTTGEEFVGMGIVVPQNFSIDQITAALNIIEYSEKDFGIQFWESSPEDRYPNVVLHIGANPKNYKKY